MGRIASAFKRLRKVNEAALIPYVTLGLYSLDITRQLVPVIARQGADLIELGTSFSDPADDGAPIDDASDAALETKVTLAECLSLAAEARRANEIPLLFMGYYSTIQKYGLEPFASDSAASGVDGVIVPDLDPEEAGDLKSACESAGIDLIFVVSSLDSDSHLQQVAEMASGFIYCVSHKGATWGHAALEEAAAFVSRMRRFTDLPLALSFGAGTPEQVAQVAALADGVAGVHALYRISDELPEEEVMLGVADYVRALKEATAKPPP
jgi:tryptophan synthase alpha chain